ncbi:MAG: hypothetical protein V1904_08800 [Bacteroidota bacterium]
MKQILFIFIAFLLAFHSECISQTTALSSDSVIKESDMTGSMWKEWYTLDSTWTKNMFPSCLLENHIKLSCAGCESISMTAQMKIDSTGKLVSYKKIKENMCGNTFTQLMEKCFLDFFFFLEFPAGFRNKTIEVRIGNGLKC